MPRRIDAEETVDSVTHFLHRLQADGWAVSTSAFDFEYDPPHTGGHKLPTRAVVRITLIPAHD